MKVLIVGAGGFIGGFIAREARSRGYETWCGVRESTSRRYLTDPALKFITLDYDDPQKLTDQLKDGQWEYVVYNLGATKCVNFRAAGLFAEGSPQNSGQGARTAPGGACQTAAVGAENSLRGV